MPKRSFDISQTSSHTSRIAGAFNQASARPASADKRIVFKSTIAKRRLLRFGVVSTNLIVVAAVGIFIFGQRNGSADTVHLAASADSTQAQASPLDQLSSANIALTVARMSNMPETTAITNQADSESVAVTQAATVNSSVSAKPQVVASSFMSAKDIHGYVVAAGDTMESIAAKFGVTSDSIRWSNNLTGNSVTIGSTLVIPPVNGIVYTVGAGDNAETIAAKFNADKDKIITFNDAELTGLTAGQRIVVPDGRQAPVITKTYASSASFALRGAASYGYNGYDYGYCTYWVALLRAKSGRPVPTNLGNASTWAIRAAAYGLATGSEPRVGAAVVTKTGGAGHVAYVTAVNGDGSITVSEMNHAGWNRTDERTIPTASNYRYVY